MSRPGTLSAKPLTRNDHQTFDETWKFTLFILKHFSDLAKKKVRVNILKVGERGRCFFNVSLRFLSLGLVSWIFIVLCQKVCFTEIKPVDSSSRVNSRTTKNSDDKYILKAIF